MGFGIQANKRESQKSSPFQFPSLHLQPMQHYAEVILPLALPQNYTYSVPPEMVNKVAVGKRVIVQFGKRKLYTALVSAVHQQAPKDFKPKDILEVEDQAAIIGEKQLQLWQWMADYYLCTMGEVMTAALPSGLKLASETVVLKNHLKNIIDAELDDNEFLVMEALETQESLSIKEISDITGLKNPLKVIQQLLGMHYILLEEELKTGYRPRQKRMVRLAEKYNGEGMAAMFEELSRAPKQKELLLTYFKLIGEMKREEEEDGSKSEIEGSVSPAVVASKLLKISGDSGSALKGLEKKGFMEIFYDSPADEVQHSDIDPFFDLNEHQLTAFAELKEHFQNKDVSLLHGVTSSGKTEIYVRFIRQMLEKNKQVLYLVPEIALTTQLITRMKKYFGEKVLVFHSRFSDRERVETWLKLVENPTEPYLIIGARSSLFLPFQNLGFVIVDEEHETSFKQYDPAPRYHARDTAILLAKLFNAKVLLGSATPSIESFTNALSGKYGLVKMEKRYANLPMPEISCVDLKQARLKKQMHGHFSTALVDEIKEVLRSGKQVILFQNRRGFSTMIQCQNCAHVNQCKNCDITLTYHKHTDLLRCHYCGFSRQVPSKCPACGSYDVKALGFGTEKLEDDLKLMLPEANIRRMDLDTTRKKNAYENIINEFEDGEVDILIGTQMVTKGLDFANVALVGILNADTLLNFPDFRSHERAYQLMAQVAGRAGRKKKQGKVIIQTSDPYHSIIRKVIENDYQKMYDDERYERKNFKYPPFYRLIKVTLKHRDRNKLNLSAGQIGRELRVLFGERVLGPEFPLVARLRNFYQMEIMLKFEKGVSLSKAKIALRDALDQFFVNHPDKKVQVIFDVDPM